MGKDGSVTNMYVRKGKLGGMVILSKYDTGNGKMGLVISPKSANVLICTAGIVSWAFEYRGLSTDDGSLIKDTFHDSYRIQKKIKGWDKNKNRKSIFFDHTPNTWLSIIDSAGNAYIIRNIGWDSIALMAKLFPSVITIYNET